jgi:hypothetical protein
MKNAWLVFAWGMAAAVLQAASPAAGIWAGRFPDRLPAVTLRVAYYAGELSGTVIFYVNQDEEIVGAEERPLVHPKFDNGVLTFEVTRPGDGQPLRFQMKLITAGAGELTGEGQTVKMKKVE